VVAGSVTAARARHEAERMFRRVLTRWAADSLRLRSLGMDRPGRRRRLRACAAPGHWTGPASLGNAA